jgi:PAS domain S-box-containing protein
MISGTSGTAPDKDAAPMTIPYLNQTFHTTAIPRVLIIPSVLFRQKYPIGRFWRTLFVILLPLFILTASSMAGDASAEESPHISRILILNSYHQGFRWTDEIVAAVITAMSGKLKKVEFNVEYMDSKRHQDKHLDEVLYKSLSLKYQRLQPDIVITSDDKALSFMKRHHPQLFPDVPVVFCGVNNVENARSIDPDYFTGLVETLDIAANIDLARRLLPKVNEIVIVSDSTATGIGMRQMVIDAEPDFPDMYFTYLNGEELNTDEMLARLRRLKPTSAVIAPAWYLDKDGHTFDNNAIYPIISEASPVPVFGTSSADLGLGILGGKLNSGTVQGEYSANQALRLLSGEVTAKDLPVEMTSQNRYMFDHRQLIRFAIAERRLPPGATIINRPVHFYERYINDTAIAVAVIILLVVIISLLIRNIRYRKKVAQDLVAQKNMVEQYLAIVGVILVALDDKGRVTLINRKGQEVLGYEENELLGQDWHKTCLPPEDYEKAIEAHVNLMSGELEHFQFFENQILTKNGEKRLIAWNNVLLKDNNGSIIGALSSGEDITERKRLEQVLRESEERYRTLHNASFGGLFIHDQGIILDCNQGLAEITGYSFDELVGLDALNRFIAPDWKELVWQNIQSGFEQPYEVEGVRKDGTIFPLLIQAKNAPYKGRTVRAVEYRDLTEVKKAEQEKATLESQLRQAQKMESIGQLAGGVAHDFNNMLSAILGHTEIAKMRCSPSESVMSHLNGIQEAALRSADLVRQLLAFARKQTIAPIVLDVNDMSAPILNMLRRVIGEDIDLSWLPGSDLWKIKMDPSQVDQILVNLCVNARDAITDVGRIIIETKNVTFDSKYSKVKSGFNPGDYVMLAVSDNGIGMSKDTQERIFEPFFTTKGMGKGTGLGLATVYGIVKQNYGFINLYSEHGKGTTFRIYLPRFIGEDMARPAEVTEDVPKSQGETVLLVEDESVLREIAKEMLKELGYRVLVADSPGEAIKLAKKHAGEIQLLITDVIMPEMNGLDLANLIRDFTPEVVCLFTSGYTASVLSHHGVLDEDVCFLPKPFSMSDLALKVQQALGQKRR